ncbi:hypothetical protein SH668x_002546 [Planctomicrobium sp. SH668]|uniref:hypothetical protein n=1 Tax=Planctomicrobium sp. SH668 TaxID=3448126 RepID=UPI003F5C564E
MRLLSYRSPVWSVALILGIVTSPSAAQAGVIPWTYNAIFGTGPVFGGGYAGAYQQPVPYSSYYSPAWNSYSAGYGGVGYAPVNSYSNYGYSGGYSYGAGYGGFGVYNNACNPCASPCGVDPCGNSNCPNGDCSTGNCGASYTPVGPVPEPTKTNPPAAQPPANPRQGPPGDDFQPVPQRENDSVMPPSGGAGNNRGPATNPNPGLYDPTNPLGNRPLNPGVSNPTPANPATSTPNSPNSIPTRDDSGFGGSVLPANPGTGIMPDNNLPASGIDTAIPKTSNPPSAPPFSETELPDFATPTNNPPPAQPSEFNLNKPVQEGDDILPDPIPNLKRPANPEVKPLELEAVPMANVSMQIQRQRVMTTARYQNQALSRIDATPAAVSTERIAHK